MRFAALLLALMLIAPAAGLTADGPSAAAVATQRPTYRLPAAPSRMIEDRALMIALADQVEASSRRALEDPTLTDAATRRELFTARRQAALVRGDYAAAVGFDKAGSGQTQASLGTDLLVTAISARQVQDDAAAVRSAIGQQLALRDDRARGSAVALRRDWALASSAYRLGEISAFADPEWRRDPVVDQDFAVAMLRLWIEINLRNPLLPALEAELDGWLKRHPDRGLNIWPDRDIVLEASAQARPITIAIWDTVDPAAFPGQMEAEATDPANGKDDDGDGFIDEAEGLAFDQRFLPTAGALPALSPELAAALGDLERYKRGVGDLAAGRDSDDVRFARAWRRRLAVSEVGAFEENYGAYGDYVHGTQVAGVAVRGLPRALLVPVRLTFGRESPPLPLDEAAAGRFVAMAETSVRYMRSRGVRLCNISWGFTPRDIETNLSQSGAEPDPARRADRAKRIFEIMMMGMTEAMQTAPEILFVVSAGNSGQDIDYVGDLPGGINLPNVLTVGAADAEGKMAGFASSGASVDLYALGVNVDCLVPGGGRLLCSGASLSAPQVINAGARLLMLKPELTAADLARLLIATASPAPGSDLKLLNPRAAAAAVTSTGARPV